jgi:hypothetical protein
MKKALVSPLENNRVAQVADAEFEVAQPLFWVDCPDNVCPEWTYDNGSFTERSVPEYVPPPQPTKAELLAELAALTAKIEALGEA